jgi:ribosome-interacting GTPase 1
VSHKPDFDQPVVLTQDRGGTTMDAFCRQIHNSLLLEFKYALVWGVSSKHYPQRVGLSHPLADEDVVQVGGRHGKG